MTQRHYTGETDQGVPFAIFYGPTGVRWKWGSDAEKFHPPAPSAAPAHASASVRSSGHAQASEASALDGIAPALDAACGLVGAAAKLVGSLASLLKWWEMRKVVQMQVATFEEERRIPWTYDMMGRWAAAHQDGDHLDLELSHFVARETVATLRALLDTPKMAVPQAMLYDLEQMRGVVGATRALLGNQFRVLQRADNFNIAGIVARALDRPDGQATLNFAWIEKWARDPRIEWDAAVASKELKKFEAELGEMSRHPEVVIDRAFGFTQAEPGKGKKDETPGHAVPLLSTIASLFGVPELVPVAVVGGGLAAAVYLVFEKLEADKAARRDDFRELALFASEVERARLLHRLWCAVDAMVRKVRGGRLLVTEQAGRLQLAAPRRDGSSYEVIASDADRVMIAV